MKKFALPIATIIVCALFVRLWFNYKERFDEVNKAYEHNTAANLDKSVADSALRHALKNLDNLEEADIEPTLELIKGKLAAGAPLGSLYDLKKRIWQVPARLLDTCGPTLAARLERSKAHLGQDESYRRAKELLRDKDEVDEPGNTTAAAEAGKETDSLGHDVKERVLNGTIKVTVLESNENPGMLDRLLKRNKPCKDVIVRLSEHYIDSMSSERRTLAWARTNGAGVVTFKGLDPEKSYSVLPINDSCEYGGPKGTVNGSLKAEKGPAEYTFYQQEFRLTIFDNKTLSEIKEKHTLTVRTPDGWLLTTGIHTGLFLAAWWVFYIVWSRRRRNSDSSIIAILMMLTGLCLLTMFSINDPLEDAMLGADMARGVIAGIAIMTLLQFVDFTKLYQGRTAMPFDIPLGCISWLFRPFRRKVARQTSTLADKERGVVGKCAALLVILLCLPLLLLDLLRVTKLSDRVDRALAKMPKGSGYLLAALLLTALLWTPFGSEVGGMKVNLNLVGLKFQPSEIAKYLIVFFMAAFFAVNANRIVKYSERGNVGLFGQKLKMLAFIIGGLLVLMAMYLVLGDMGPALVLAFTFIILYSIIKSKVDLERVDNRHQNTRILTCDLAMLAYGVGSFLACLAVGHLIDSMGWLCLAWFAAWILMGVVRKQLFESPLIFNIIIAGFIFGGPLMEKVPLSKFHDIAERLESRSEMCTNTWGTLPLDGMTADAGSNKQVAEGLWGLASGGLTGQGLGNGSPNTIPAFHTDMILESMGEQMGFAGILAIILLLALLLRRSVVTGYRSAHPFAFYLCTGIAVVTAIQFIIISLGSTGIIPLTGITVPLLSYGNVSMILNLAAFGIVLSYADGQKKRETNEASAKNIEQYNYPVALLSWVYCGIAAAICCVFVHYQYFDRDATLIRPVYINNEDGIPVVEYNPRIAQLTAKMWAGDIYDRNGVLLATSNPNKLKDYSKKYKDLGLEPCDTIKYHKRYYPFGPHLAFMLGELGSDVAELTSVLNGYMAEYRHLSELRGFDNILYANVDGEVKPVKITLSSNKYKPGRFSDTITYTTPEIQLRDYSALIPYLKEGYNGSRVKRMQSRDDENWKIGNVNPADIRLTIDAMLQTALQNKISAYVDTKIHTIKRTQEKIALKSLNKLRISVVVLDAENGDLLSSAVYPLPDKDRLRQETEAALSNGKKFAIYNDKDRDPSVWRSYSDMDLGLTFATAPGSTAKVMTGLAGFRKYKDAISTKKYYVYPLQKIYPGEPEGEVDMKTAYEKSSDCYFIHLLNDNDLFEDLSHVYGELGISINGKKSYGMIYDTISSAWLEMVTKPSANSVKKYQEYMRENKRDRMVIDTCWAWAWGQNLDATPLSMARAISVVANGGDMPKTRYLLSDDDKGTAVPIVDSTNLLTSYLKIAADANEFNNPHLGGKTGTAERYNKTKVVKQKDGTIKRVPIDTKDAKENDGWYICFIDNATITKGNDKKEGKLAVAIRMERIGKSLKSETATGLMKEVVLDVLKSLKFIEKNDNVQPK